MMNANVERPWRSVSVVLALIVVFVGLGRSHAEETAVASDGVAPAACRVVHVDGIESEPATIKLVNFEPASVPPLQSNDVPELLPPPPTFVPTIEETHTILRDDHEECGRCEPGEKCADCKDAEGPPIVRFGEWIGYNPVTGSTTWLAGGDFAMTSLESFPTLEIDDDAALTFGTGFHFLSGPTGLADLPPRLFDFQMAFQARKPLNEVTTLDLKLGVGAFSDFETSARKGVRFPGHVVAHTQFGDRFAAVYGVDVLDRDDISVLPVAGLIWQPADDLIVDIVFPRPRVQLRLGGNRTMSLGGEIGGGTWAVERDDRSRDNATYHDLRVTWGIATVDDESESNFEIGWAFDRELTYRSGRGDTQFDGAFLARWQTKY